MKTIFEDNLGVALLTFLGVFALIGVLFTNMSYRSSRDYIPGSHADRNLQASNGGPVSGATYSYR